MNKILITYRNDSIGNYLPFVFFHGELEKLDNDDGSKAINASIDDLTDGKYDVIIKDHEDRPATMFLWWSFNHTYIQGLIVYNDDTKAFKDAVKKFNKKPHVF